MIKGMRIQMIATQRCNAICEHCDKAVGYARIGGLEYTEADMQRHAKQLGEQGLSVRRLTISGGEPIVNKELQGILDAAPPVREGRLLTNALTSTEAARHAISLPENWRWVPAPLDDVTDPRSGKNDATARPTGRVHHAYWISPADYGFNATFEKCGVRGYCGRGLDRNGWSMCGQAPILGPLLGINPYGAGDDVDIIDHVMTPIQDMCKHCIYGLGRRGAKQFRWKVKESVSKTFVAAFKRIRSFAKRDKS